MGARLENKYTIVTPPLGRMLIDIHQHILPHLLVHIFCQISGRFRFKTIPISVMAAIL